MREVNTKLLLGRLPLPLLYLQVDAEGRDDAVLRGFPLDDPALSPSVGIMFEHVLLPEARFKAVMKRLHASGYTTQCQIGQNILSLRPE